MRKVSYILILILFFHQTDLVFAQTAAFIDSTQINKFLDNPELSQNIKDYYEGRFKPSDDDKTYELLKSITKKNDQFFPIFFNTLNEIIQVSDGALAEMITEFCFEMINNYPAETFDYFTKNKNLSLEYAGFLGSEFYFKEKGTSSIKMTCKEFQKDLKLKLNLKDSKVNETYLDFINEVERMMKNMN